MMPASEQPEDIRLDGWRLTIVMIADGRKRGGLGYRGCLVGYSPIGGFLSIVLPCSNNVRTALVRPRDPPPGYGEQ